MTLSALSKKVERKVERRQIRFETERLMRNKRSEEYETLEEVFDKPTLMTIYDLLNQGVIGEIYGVVKSGKESRIYGGVDPEGERIAIKIYLTGSAEFKSGMLTYIAGDPRFRVVKKSSRSIIYTWAQKEFKNLLRAYESGIPVPKPLHVEKNVLVMEFIGEDDAPAPTLKDKPPKNPSRMYKILLGYVKSLYTKANLVHSDLSEYNIMNLNKKPVIFDMSQSVHVEHPRADEFLLRDLKTLNRFFEKLGVKVKNTDSLYKWVVRDEHAKHTRQNSY